MQFNKIAFVCAILALSILEPIAARKGFSSRGGGHSYPKSGGLSGHGGSSGHGYPPSGGLSGGGRGYPSSGTNHGYPSSGNNHGYPSSGGLSGSGGRGYPSSGGTGSHGYPASGGLSGNSNNRGGSTVVHHHYHYSPPSQISYSPVRGAPAQSYPVYRGTPPTYVYQYKDSGSKYGTLLAGLALLNLGALAGTAYAVSHANNGGGGGGNSGYKYQKGELCKFGVKKDNGDYEETRIDCQIISSFIYQDMQNNPQHGGQKNETTVTNSVVTVVNNTMINPNPAEPAVNQTATKVLYEMLANGTLVPVNVPLNNTGDIPTNTANNTMTSSVTTTNTTTTVTNALDVKGKPVDVTPGMQCYLIRTTPVTNMKKGVPCGLLQTYAEKSISRNSAIRSVPTFALVATILFAIVMK